MEIAVDGTQQGRALAAILRGELLPVSAEARYALAALVLGVALAARSALAPPGAGLAFVTFYPAVVLSALLLGAGPGLLTLTFCTGSAFMSLVPGVPAYEFQGQQLLAIAIFSGSGLVICLLAQQMRRRAHDLHLSERRFRGLFEDAPVGQLLIDAESLRVLECNQAAADIHGCRREELCRLRVADVELGLGEVAAAAIRSRLLGGETVQFEAKLRRNDGRVRDLAVTVVPISSKEGCRFLATQIDNSERWAAEGSLRDALRESEDLYQNAPCGYHSLNGDGIIIRINDTELKLLGYRREEVIGRMGFRDLLAPTSLARFEQTFPQFKKTGFVKDLEFDLRRKDGLLVPVLLSASAVVDGQGRFVMSRSTINDITERRRAAEIQRRHSRSLRLLSECSMELLRTDAEQALLDAICRLIVQTGGYRMAWIGVAAQDEARIVRPVAQAGDDEGYLERVPVSWDEAREGGDCPTGTAIRTGVPQVDQDLLSGPAPGQWRRAGIECGHRSAIALPLAVRAQTIGVLTIVAGEPDAFTAEEVALLEELARNLTFGILMRRTRAQHMEAETQLQASEERLQLALSATNLGIFDFDLAGRKLTCDSRARELWGVASGEPVTYDIFKSGVHPDDWPAVRAAIDQACEGANDGEYSIQYRVISLADAGERHVSASGRIYFEAGRAARSIGVVKDVTARKRLERAEQERRSELELICKQQVAVQTAVAIAHELNQPLVSISVYCGTALQLLARGHAAPEKLNHALQGAVDQSQRAGRTLHELVAFLHKGESALEAIDLNDLVREANSISMETATGKLRPVLELEPGLPPVFANRLQVQKVLLNLLLNSAEALAEWEAPQRPATIVVKTTALANMAQVTVQDSGPGLEAEKAHRIFDPFFTTKPHGMGLGLAISRALIEAHGGRLWTDGKKAPGATFHFTLPFAS